MRKFTLMVALVVVTTALVPATAVAQSSGDSCSFPVERTDATGTTVTVSEEPNSVVTLNPSAAQTMWEIGAQEKVVGVTKHASNLAGAASKTNISGNGQTINNEEVVGLQPDLVLAPNTVQNDTVNTLRSAGLTIYRFHEAENIEDIKDKTRLIGQFVGACEGASETVAWMESRLATVDETVADAERPDVIYSFFGFTSGANTFIDTILERAGGNNVAVDAGVDGYKQINEEILVQQDPDWIVLNSDDDQVPATEGYNATTAVQNDQIVVINTNHLNRPAPRVVYAVTKLAETFHPEAYAAANATATETPVTTDTDPTVTATETATETVAESPTATETSGESGPGFGLGATLLALLTAAGLARRRR